MRTLNAKNKLCDIVPGLYAACDTDITVRILWNVLLTTMIAKIFIRIDSNVISLKFFNGTFGLFGLGNGVSCPNFFSDIPQSLLNAWLCQICADVQFQVHIWLFQSGIHHNWDVCCISTFDNFVDLLKCNWIFKPLWSYLWRFVDTLLF